MGDPAVPTPAERADTLAKAKAVVQAVIDDEQWPEPLDMLDGRDDAISAIFRVCQDLVDTRAALEQACDALETEGLEETAHRLRKLDLVVR